MDLDRTARTLPLDIVVGLLAGLVATQATNLAQGPLNRMTPRHVKRRERQARPGGASSEVAADKTVGGLDLDLGERGTKRLGRAIHFGVGAAWGPVYGLLRRHAGLGPVGAGLAAGAAMSLVLDEALVPALGLSAPNPAYPRFTHVRGFAAHLVFGAAAALCAELVYRATGTGPDAEGSAAHTGPD